MLPKFRVWDKVNGTMHKVEGINFGINGARVISLAEMNRYNNNHKRWHTDVELLQSTGLFDKNGKEIFEGDIVKGPMDFGPAGWIESIAPVSYHKIYGYQLHYFLLEHTEIIGNIYEHPHLLEED